MAEAWRLGGANGRGGARDAKNGPLAVGGAHGRTIRQCLVRPTWSVILVGGTAAGGRAYRAASALRSGNCVLADSLARSRKVEAKPMHSSARA
jgi:hypothetical protein